jgi:hypothetical protein
MQWDLGLPGVGLLVAMSLGVGLIAQFLAGRRTSRWLWLIAAAVSLVCGLFTSEVWFGWATEEELQPNIDGLSRDEVLLSSVLTTAVVVLVMRYLAHRAKGHRGRHLLGRHHGQPSGRA